MKIIYILHSLNRIAPNTVIMNIIENIVDKTHEIFIISLFTSQEDNYKEFLSSINVKFIEYQSQLEAFKDLDKLSKIIKEFDILHLNQYKSNEIGNILHKYKPELKVISTCHSVEDDEAKGINYRGNAKIASVVRLREQSNFYQKHTNVVAVSNEVKKYLSRIGCTKTSIIYNGVNYAKFPLTSFYKREEDEINFCQIGHIMPLKNQLYSLKLMKYLKSKRLSIKLHIFGKDDYGKEYKCQLLRYIRKFNLEKNVIFYNELKWNKLFEFLKKMNILIMPSTTEGLPLALIESFYFNMAAIVSNNGGMKEVVENYRNGLVIYNIHNQKNFEKIYYYCMKKRYLRDGKSARKNALKRFDSKVMAEQYYSKYIKLLDKS